MHNLVLTPIGPEKLITDISERGIVNILKAVQNNNPPTEQPEQLLTVQEAAQFKNQLKTIFQYLQEHIATASMISAATGIPQKNICRYKRKLEIAGQLWEVEKKRCKHTGYKAWYLTTNPEQAPFNNQLNLFSTEL